MDLSKHIDTVHQRALRLHQRANESPVQPDLMTAALKDLNFVLEELQTAQEELVEKNQTLINYHQQLETERQRYQELFNLAPDGYLVSDTRGVIQEANVAIADMLKVSQENLIGKPLVLFFPEKDHLAFYSTLTNLHRINATNPLPVQTWDTQLCSRQVPTIDVAITLSCGRQGDGTVTSLRWLIRDITQRKQAEAKIYYQAFYDQLTGLPNRAFFKTYLAKALAQAERHDTKVGIMFLDLDRFKVINDTLGHDVGDLLLQQTAQRLASCLRAEDLLVRWGGDEFVLVLSSAVEATAMAHTCDRILDSLQPSFLIHHHELHVSTSIGVAFFPQDGRDREILLRHADQALYRAKNEGGRTYRFYQASLNKHTAENLRLEYELYKAIDNHELSLYFQPQIDYATGQIIAVEALLRWQHPRRGLLLPGCFLSLAEGNGQIVAIGEWVLREGMHQVQRFQATGFPNLTLAINLSAKQLHQANLVERIYQILQDLGYNPALLELEITETAAIQQLQHSQTVMDNLIQLGVKISLDDFGTGYSSLQLLKQLPLHKLKVDRSFIADLNTNSQSQAIVSAIITLAAGLNLEVVAEGVETKAQAIDLQTMGCNHIQGYWFSPPLPATEVMRLLSI